MQLSRLYQVANPLTVEVVDVIFRASVDSIGLREGVTHDLGVGPERDFRHAGGTTWPYNRTAPTARVRARTVSIHIVQIRIFDFIGHITLRLRVMLCVFLLTLCLLFFVTVPA